jgi:predicted RNA methylase
VARGLTHGIVPGGLPTFTMQVMGSGNKPSYTLLGALRAWWAERHPKFGTVGSVRQFGREMYEFLRDSTPERKRLRFGDIDYDWEYRVNTTEGAVSTRARLIGTLAGSLYQPTEPSVFREMLSALPINYRHFTFIDIGSGKGRTLLMASDYPFRRIIGIELLPELHQIAQENIRKYKSESQRSFAIESHCTDARNFVFPNDPLVLYLFNPLPESGMRAVIANLEQSLKAQSRDAYVVYHNPEHRALLEQSFLRRFMVAHQFAIYRAIELNR